jgi:NAD(P)H-hydrate epimerase
MQRNPSSHKGENGKVAVIGGSPLIHGAPLLSALAAEAVGTDLIFVALPRIHEQIARMTSLNFQVHPFAGDDLAKKDIEPLLELLATMDSAVIGPGLSRTPDALSLIRTLIASAPCALVLDASALQPWTLGAASGKTAVLTPHLGELERMVIPEEKIGDVAKEHLLTIHLKGQIDCIAARDGTVQKVSGGNAGLTVGGTGDALAGCIAGLLAQGLAPKNACKTASTIMKRAGTILFERQGYAYTAQEVIAMLPHLLHTYDF